MPNGKSGDHPLTDLFVHKLEVYGPEADELIRKIRALCSQRELDQWWEREIAWSKNRDLVLRKAKTRFEELLKRAKDGSWEIQQ
ncbi:MAG TPA: hypothetical protein VKJ65_04155 [Phycisphaerae bacterium]|nr:hypothetical protein [Phycisphaerae bacterium]